MEEEEELGDGVGDGTERRRRRENKEFLRAESEALGGKECPDFWREGTSEGGHVLLFVG